MKRHWLLFIILICIPGWVAAVHAGIYTWTDEDGVVHYSDIEPVAPGTPVSVDKDIPYDAEADAKSSESNTKELDAISNEVEAELRQEEQREKARRLEEQKEKKPSREETIAAEKERLEQTIADLEARPLSDFGSAKNKRLRIGFYKYRLEELQQDPDKYFGWGKK